MSFLSSFPALRVKFSHAVPVKFAYDRGAGVDTVSFCHRVFYDSGSESVVTGRGLFDYAVGTDYLPFLRLPASDAGHEWSLVGKVMSVLQTGAGLEILNKEMRQIVAYTALDRAWLTALQLTSTADIAAYVDMLLRGDTSLIDACRALVDNLRYVSYGEEASREDFVELFGAADCLYKLVTALVTLARETRLLDPLRNPAFYNVWAEINEHLREAYELLYEQGGSS